MVIRSFSLAKRVVAAFALFSALGAVSSGAQAQTIDEAFFNTFELTGGAQGNYIFGSPFAELPKAVALVSGSSVTLQPNFSLYEENPNDAFWRDNNGAGPGGNKWVEMNVYDNEFVVASGSETIETFVGCASSNTLASPYTSTAYIRIFSADFSQVFGEVTANASGTFDLSIPVAGDADVNVQKGFTTSGPNANSADAASLGSVNIAIGAPCAGSGPGGGAQDSVGIPVMPIWLLVLLAGVMGVFGARAVSKRS